MRFLLDENVPRPLRRALQSQGHDVKVIDRRLVGAADSHIIDICNEEERLLITMDRGIRGEGIATGLILIRAPRRQTSRAIVEMVLWVLSRLDEHALLDQATTVWQGRFQQADLASH